MCGVVAFVGRVVRFKTQKKMTLTQKRLIPDFRRLTPHRRGERSESKKGMCEGGGGEEGGGGVAVENSPS